MYSTKTTTQYAGSETERHRIHDIQAYGIDTRHFVIYLQGVEDDPYEELEEPGVEYRMANRFIKNLDILTGISPSTPITVSMKTCGGDWLEGMAMYDAILATPNPISIINYTHARSMSSLILQAANKRIMMPHSIFMYHQGEYGTYGTWKQAYTEMEFFKDSADQMLEVYVDAIKRTPHSSMVKWARNRIKDWLSEQMNNKEEVYMSASDAVKAGFADTIWTNWDEVIEYTPIQLERK